MNQREICLVPFPFSDVSRTKVRPAVVISNDNFNTSQQDVILCAITSRVDSDNILDLGMNSKTGLKHKSGVKISAVFKLEKSLILKSIGKVDTRTHNKIVKKLVNLLE